MTHTLAPYACSPHNSRGRLKAEDESNNNHGLTRSIYQRDRDRIVHSSAFRRLEGKTQVFISGEGDHFRTRLTHSLEVAQLARCVCRTLSANEDLGEAISLAHDLGHPPFGHAGEDALNDNMRDYGGFDHNVQTLRILTTLERKYAEFDGMNLSWECLEGLLKHNGPVAGKHAAHKNHGTRSLDVFSQLASLQPERYAALEAQISAVCDDIAYNNHDIEDGLRAGLFTVRDVMNIPLIGEMFSDMLEKYPTLDGSRMTHEVKRRVINKMVTDLVEVTSQNIRDAKPQNPDDIRSLGRPIAHLSTKMQESNREIKAFLRENMYRHFKVNRMRARATRVVNDLFTFFMENQSCLPKQWADKATQTASDKSKRAEIICDYIAGMTDPFAISEHEKIFGISQKFIGDYWT